MRAHTAVFTLSLLMSTAAIAAAGAADVRAPSTIDAVVVFPSGAEVSRLVKLRIPAGEHTVVINDLPVTAVGHSIRVEGKSTGTLQIGSVDSRRAFVTWAEQENAAAERKRLEREIETANDERQMLQADMDAAAAQRKLFEELAGLPGKTVPAGSSPMAQPDWAQIGTLIGERMAAAQRAMHNVQMKMRDIDRRLEDLRGALQAVAPAAEERTEVRIAVAASGALEADLTLRYQVHQAAWTPQYDARLATGTRTQGPRLQLVRRATIQQRTGEAWTNVALSLSTTRPTQGSQAPDLPPMLVETVDPQPVRPRVAMESAPTVNMAPMPAAPMARTMSAAGADAAQKAAEEIRATIDGNAFQALYGIPGRTTVVGNGEAKRVQIDATDLEPALLSRTVPKRDPKAFLYAKLTTPRTTAILAGQVSLFRDNTFVGTARFPQLAPGEDHEFGFGQDDNIIVKYAVTDEKRGETGIISTSKTEAKSFKVTVKNLHARPMPVRIVDQFPVALSQDLKVDITAKPTPTTRDPDDKRGLAHWDLTLAPDEERTIEFGYRLTWPAAKQLQAR